MGSYKTSQILSVFDKLAKIQLFKPIASHRKRGIFCLIAKNVQPTRPEAVAPVNGHEDPPKVASEPKLAGELSDILRNFGEGVINLGERNWQMQKEALANASWAKKPKRETRPEQISTSEASTTATDNAAVAVHDSEEDWDDTGELDDIDTTPVLGKLSTPMAKRQADSADVYATMKIWILTFEYFVRVWEWDGGLK